MTTNEKAAPPPAAARGDVRGLVAKWRAEAASMESLHCKQTGYEVDWSFRAKEEALDYCADELEAALAAEGVQAGEVEQRARELLAQQYDEFDPDYAQAVRDGEDLDQDDTIALRAIASALSQQPEARGVVDGDALRDARTIYDIACIRESRDNATREDVEFKAICLRNYNRIAALTEARNVR